MLPLIKSNVYSSNSISNDQDNNSNQPVSPNSSSGNNKITQLFHLCISRPSLRQKIDKHNLLRGGDNDIEEAYYAWFLNLALLRDAVKQTQSPKIKEKIHFLINNYLDKSSSIRNNDMKNLMGSDSFNEDYQSTPYETCSYHRTGFLDSRFINIDAPFNEQLALPNESPLILTETDEIEQFFGLYFPIDIHSAKENWEEDFVNKLLESQNTRSLSMGKISENISSYPQSDLESDLEHQVLEKLPPGPIQSDLGIIKIDPQLVRFLPNLQNHPARGIPSASYFDTIRSALLRQLKRRLESLVKIGDLPYDFNPPFLIQRHLQRQMLKVPNVLFDFTSILAPYIKTDGQKDKEALFRSKLREIQDKLDQALEKAIDRYTAKGLNLNRNDMNLFLKEKIIGIVRVEMDAQSGEKCGGIKILPLFNAKLDKADLKITHQVLVTMIGHTGLALSPVKMRKLVTKDYQIQKDLKYAVTGPNVRYLQTKEDFLNLSLFKRLFEKFNSSALKNTHPHMAVLGKPTIQILTTLIKKWSIDDWETLNQDPATRMVVQTSLYKIKELFASAELCMNANDYTHFALCIELIHCELAALLELSHPYEKDDFSKIYKQKLMGFKIIPKSLAGMTKAGLNRNAMNLFAGLLSHIIKNTPNPSVCYGSGLYYEARHIIGSHSKVQDVVADPTVQKVDLYACQTNPNMEVELGHTRYSQDNIIVNIKALLLKNAKSQIPLTVAIDSTIENFNSDKIKEILREFKKEIKKGKVNFVIFSSGQKFDMLGQDNYFGAPYYMINNGDSKWDSFNKLFSAKIFQPDTLSQQWFCLAYQDPISIDEYRNLIFKNTKEIMKKIPAKLKYDNNKYKYQDVFIGEFDEKLEPCFIDIKVLGLDYNNRSKNMAALFYQICTKRGVKAFRRSSFGFNHHNISRGGVSIRINPGLNAEENGVILEYLEEIAAQAAHGCNKLELDKSYQVDMSAVPVVPKQVVEDTGFRGELYSPLPDAVVEKIKGKSWREACPVPLEDLAYLKVKHYDLKGQISSGEIIFHKNLAPELLEIFKELFEAKYPIDKMLLVDNYGPDDGLSMRDNNSYAFCYRKVTGNSQQVSVHSYGCAIDLNPLINPYIKNDVVYPEGSESFLDRSQAVPGLIQKDDACHRIFMKHGYQWGGDWQNRDYHHFEKIDKGFLNTQAE